MLPNALEHMPELLTILRGGNPVVFSDYDGTLTPIVERPDLAELSPPMRTVLSQLTHSLPVAIISGRALEDVRSKVALPGLYYSGNHGLESCDPDGSLLSAHGAHLTPALQSVLQNLRRELGDLEGVLIEDKGLSASVHYRLAKPANAPRIERAVDVALRNQSSLRKHLGKKVFEIRPAVSWNKGKVLNWLMERMNLPNPVPLYLGDDVTDEDAFVAIHDHGVGIHVGPPPAKTAARWQLRDPAAVERFLDTLTNALETGDGEQRTA